MENEYFENLADETEKCLQSRVEHFEVETEENKILCFPPTKQKCSSCWTIVQNQKSKGMMIS